jgi:hypothetical protein
MADLLSQDVNKDSDISWSEKTRGQKWGDVFSFGIADTVRDNKLRLQEIKKSQEEANASEWNTAKVTPQMLDSYNKWSQEYAQMKAAEKYGLTDAEKNLAINQNAQGMNFAQMNAERAGGNAGAYINSVLNAGNNEFGLKLASADAELQRQKRMQTLSALEGLNRSAGVFQDVNSMNFQKQMLAEQALGQAESDWYATRAENRRQALNTGASLASTLIMANAQKSKNSGGGGVDPATLATAVTAFGSDIRLKKNIIYSHTENGHKIYEFEYINEPNIKYSGVMAQEVIKTHPSAVIEENGYYKVNYDMLGLTMKKIN